MTEHVPGKPHVGQTVYYFSPKLTTISFSPTGYGGRREGPYAAIVTNNLGHGLSLVVLFPGMAPLNFDAIPHKDDATGDKAYWDWRSPLEAARAAKESKDKLED